MATRRYAHDDRSDDSDNDRRTMKRPQRGQSPLYDDDDDDDRDAEPVRQYRRPQRRTGERDNSDDEGDNLRRAPSMKTRRPPPLDPHADRAGGVRNSGERSSFTPKSIPSVNSRASANAWGESRKDNWVEKENSRPTPTQSWTSATRTSHDRDRDGDRDVRGSRNSRDGSGDRHYRHHRYDSDEEDDHRAPRDPSDRRSRSRGSDDVRPDGDRSERYTGGVMRDDRDDDYQSSRGRGKRDKDEVGEFGASSRHKPPTDVRRSQDRDDRASGGGGRSRSRGSEYRDDDSRGGHKDRRDSFDDHSKASKGSDYREEVYKHALTTYGSQSATGGDSVGGGSRHRRGSNASRSSSADEYQGSDESEERGKKEYTGESASHSSSPRSGVAFLMHSPASGGGTDLVQCLIVRERNGMGSKMYPSYKLFLEDKNKLLMIGRKMNFNSTSNYHMFDMTRGSASKKLTKKSGNYLGKLRAADTNRTEYALVTRSEVREEVAAVVFDRVGLVTQIKDGCQPRKMSVLLPQLNAESQPIPHRTENKHGQRKSMVDMLKREDTSRMFLLTSKEPVYENGNYRLNFHGRVSVPSVKNFQLSSPDDPGHVICQFGKIGDDRFHLDYKAPLNAFQAFSLALCHFDA